MGHLSELEDDLMLPEGTLEAFMVEDDVGGYPDDWPTGSMFAKEGQLLYALVRALRPETVVEFGVRHGCSSLHILKALVCNEKGCLYSYDPYPQIMWDRFTNICTSRWNFQSEDAFTANLPEQADIVFEDTLHDFRHTEGLISRGLELNPRLVISHDSEHYLVGEDVTKGFNAAIGGVGKSILFPGSDCGFIYTLV